MTGTYAAAVQRFLIGRIVATAGAAVALIGTFLPWLRSGTRRRSSFEIFSLVDRLGISQSGVIGWGLRLWPVVPFLFAAAVTLQWFRRRWLTEAAAVVAVVYTGLVAVAVRSAPTTSLIAIGSGPVVTLVGVLLLAAGAVATSARHHATRAPGEGPGGGRS
ncbi:MAG: hypothetical protein ABI949_14720 [Ilumatobacteraceae bacterium]